LYDFRAKEYFVISCYFGFFVLDNYLIFKEIISFSLKYIFTSFKLSLKLSNFCMYLPVMYIAVPNRE